MNKKSKTYILLCVVIIIWGIIVYRIINYTKPRDIDISTNIVDNKQIEQESFIDTFSLLLNYKDPFYYSNRSVNNGARIDKSPKVSSQLKVLKKEDLQIKIIWPEIIYGGIIVNRLTGQKVNIVRINNKDYLMRKNDIIDDIKLDEIFTDSIRVVKGSEYKTIIKH